MNLLSSTFTDEFRLAVANHNSESWSRLISDLAVDIDYQFLQDSGTLDKDQLHIENQKRVAIQQLLLSLITTDED